MSDYDLSIHHNPDASAWAKFFMETKERVESTQTDEFVTQDNMLGWFANAMMAMHDSQWSTIRNLPLFGRIALAYRIIRGKV